MTWRQTEIVSLLAVILVVGIAASADYESSSNRPIAEVLPAELAKGPFHTVKDPVVADGYMYHYQIESSFGPFETTGTGALRKLVHEIWAIAELRNITGSEAFLVALKDQAAKPLAFAKNVITKPAETLTGVPRGVRRLVSNVSTSVSSTPDPSQDSRTKELLLVGGFKRDYAARYGVDPYSSNKVLQEELDKIGKAAAFGSWTASAATMPIGGTAGAVVSGTALSQSLNNVLKAEPPTRIRTLNESKLQQMGIPADLASQFLDHKVYTPRHDLIIVDSLARLTNVAGRDAYLSAILVAEDEEEANFFMNTAQLMRGYHEKVGRIMGITMVKVLPVAQTKSGVAIIPFALDRGVWTANADRISQHLTASYRAPGSNGRFELWVTGTVSPMARQQLAARGFGVVENAGSRFEIVD